MIAQADKDRRNVVDSPGSSLAARAGIDKSDRASAADVRLDRAVGTICSTTCSV